MAVTRDLFGRLVAIAAVTMLAACGGGPDAQAAADDAAQAQAAADDSFDPCSLVTREEVAAALGWQPTSVTPSKGEGGIGTCYYGTADSLAMPPQKVEVGIQKCPFNIPCYEDLPRFDSGEELAEYRLKAYEGAYAGAAKVEPLDGFGVPAIHQDMLGLHSVELYVGPNRLAYVTTFTNFDIAKGLAEKLMARIK